MSKRLCFLILGMAAILGVVAWIQSIAQQRQSKERRERVDTAMVLMGGVPVDLTFQREPDWLTRDLAHGDCFELRGGNGQSVLALAAHGGWPNAVANCLDNGLDPNDRDFGGVTPLMWVGVGGNAEVARLLIAAGADVNAADNGGVTALMMAAHYGRADVIGELLNHGAKVDQRDGTGKTALMYAAGGFDSGSRALKTAELMLRAGADPKAKDAKGFSAITWAHMEPNKQLEWVLQTWKPAK